MEKTVPGVTEQRHTRRTFGYCRSLSP